MKYTAGGRGCQDSWKYFHEIFFLKQLGNGIFWWRTVLHHIHIHHIHIHVYSSRTLKYILFILYSIRYSKINSWNSCAKMLHYRLALLSIVVLIIGGDSFWHWSGMSLNIFDVRFNFFSIPTSWFKSFFQIKVGRVLPMVILSEYRLG